MTLRNWAGNLTYSPGGLVEPRSLDELVEVVTGTPRLHVLGSRHCFNDIADAPVLVGLDRMPQTIDLDPEAATVRVAGAVRYGTLADHLHSRGWALPNLASLPHISVAGAVATATHGSGDGLQNLAAAVVGLQVVTADGTLLELDTTHPDLEGAVVHLGALGAVVTVTLAVEPTFEVAQAVHTDLPWAAVRAHLDEITSSADSVSLFTDWRGGTVAQVWRKSRFSPGRPDGGAARLEALGAVAATGQVHPVAGMDPTTATAQLGVPGPWHERLPHFRMEFTPSAGAELQSEYLVPREHAVDALEAVRTLSAQVSPLLLVSEVRTVAADRLWLSTAYERESVGIHFTWRPRQPEVEALLPRLEEALLPFAPRPHWGKLFSAEVAGAPDRLERHYRRLADFRALAARLDPHGRFHTPFLTRHGLVGAPRA